jgi:hypothetical protein
MVQAQTFKEQVKIPHSMSRIIFLCFCSLFFRAEAQVIEKPTFRLFLIGDAG